ncbi:hypothetical protein [Allosphingosinicella humi]
MGSGIRATSVALSLTLAMASPAFAQTITDPAAFASAIAGVRAGDRSTDKFAEPVPLPIEGKSFRLTMPALDGSEGQGTVFYDYADGVLILDASPRNVWPTLAGPSESLPSFKVTDNTQDLGSYVGQNAYGATARVSVFKNSGAAIAILSSPKPMLSPMRVKIKASNLDDTDWWVKLELPPAEAKAVANDTIGIIEGEYARLPSGKAGACMSTGVSATINRPSSYSSETCYVGAHIERIALVRKSTGAVIKEWTNDTAPRLGPVLWGKVQVGMNKRDLTTVYPSITSYSYLESDGAQVNLEKQVVASVEVRNWPVKGTALAMLLTEKYGQPIEIDCKYEYICQGQWKVAEGVSAYMTTLGVLYQLTDTKPPITYSIRR